MLLQQDINKKEPKSTIDEQMNEAMGETPSIRHQMPRWSLP